MPKNRRVSNQKNGTNRGRRASDKRYELEIEDLEEMEEIDKNESDVEKIVEDLTEETGKQVRELLEDNEEDFYFDEEDEEYKEDFYFDEEEYDDYEEEYEEEYDDYEEENEEEYDYDEVETKAPFSKKTTKLCSKLEKLKSKLENDELTPFKRFVIENKLSIIETKLEKQLSKLKIQELEDKYADDVDTRNAEYIEQLKLKNDEINELFNQIEEQERIIEQKTSNVRNRSEEFDQVNKLLQKQAKRDYREPYQFGTPEKIKAGIEEEEAKLEKLRNQKDLKLRDVEDFIEEYDNNEDKFYEESAKQIKEYRPSIWKSLKSAFSKIGENFRNWRKNSKAEKQAVKEAKRNAIKEARGQQAESSVETIDKRNEAFKNRYSVDIPVEKQTRKIRQVFIEDLEKEDEEEKDL